MTSFRMIHYKWVYISLWNIFVFCALETLSRRTLKYFFFGLLSHHLLSLSLSHLESPFISEVSLVFLYFHDIESITSCLSSPSSVVEGDEIVLKVV